MAPVRSEPSIRNLADIAARLRARRAESTVDRFHRLYYGHSGRTWQNTRWLGVPLQKCPLDLWVYQELLTEIRPELVIETGSFAGGSALYLASCMDLIQRGRVISIDIVDRERPQHERIRFIAGSSTDQSVISQVERAAEDASPVMVILDSDHSRGHVLAELWAYAPLVTPGSYLVVEDTNIGRPVETRLLPGPHEAVEEFLSESPQFARDPSREKFFLTFNPGGFLRRREGG